MSQAADRLHDEVEEEVPAKGEKAKKRVSVAAVGTPVPERGGALMVRKPSLARRMTDLSRPLPPDFLASLQAAADDKKAFTVIPWDSIKIQSVIAKGSFGRVTKGSYNFAPVAVKELHRDAASGIEELVEEVEAMRIFSHVNILTVIGLATDYKSHLGLVMEFLPASLFSVLHEKPYLNAYGAPTWATCLLGCLTDIADGLAHMHRQNCVHRDLKLQNVLLTESWEAKICDFGEMLKKAVAAPPKEAAKMRRKMSVMALSSAQLAEADPQPGACGCLGGGGKAKANVAKADIFSEEIVAPSAPTAGATAAGSSGAADAPKPEQNIRGSAPYVSPEAASAGSDKPLEVGPPADVWGFGCCLAHLAAACPPYVDALAEGRYKDIHDVIAALRNGSARPLSQLTNDNCPTELQELAGRCCNYELGERLTMEEVGERLRQKELIRNICYPAKQCMRCGLRHRGACGSPQSVTDDDDEMNTVVRPNVRLKTMAAATKPKAAAAAKDGVHV